jgi:hypothetical protein
MIISEVTSKRTFDSSNFENQTAFEVVTNRSTDSADLEANLPTFPKDFQDAK